MGQINQPDHMLNQVIEICGIDALNCPICGFDACSCDDYDYGDGDPASGPPIERFLGTKDVWVTKDHERIPATEMTDAHIINTIKYLERRKRTDVATYPTLLLVVAERKLDIGVLNANSN
jgi:hypothetical protein